MAKSSTKPFRITHVIHSLAATAGGPPVICTRLAAAQAAQGHKVTVVAELGDPSGVVSQRVEGVDFQLISGVSRLSTLVRGPASRELAAWCQTADVVHLHGVWDALLLAAGREARRAGTPYVVMPHGMLDPWSLSQKWWKKRIGLRFGTRSLLDMAAALHLGNRDEVELIQPVGLNAPAFIVPNGVAPEDLQSLRGGNDFRARRPELRSDPYVLFLSRIHYKKGLDVLAEAFSVVARANAVVNLVVAGADDGEQASFESRVKAYGLSNRVHLVGPLYGLEKRSALAGAACFCLPSRQEGFSMAILEALACRRPVVITEHCHFPEVREAGAGIVVPLDPSHVAEAILTIIGDPAGGDRMGAAGRQLVESHYTWDRVAEHLNEHYNRLALTRK